MKKLFVLLIIFCSLLYSHPGRLDSNGGHRDSRTGTYHYQGRRPLLQVQKVNETIFYTKE